MGWHTIPPLTERQSHGVLGNLPTASCTLLGFRLFLFQAGIPDVVMQNFAEMLSR